MTPYDALVAPFVEFDFMRRALVGSLALSVGSAPIGVFLMLRRMSLAGDAMAHAILPGAAVGFLVAGLSLPAMTIGGLAAGVAVAVLAGLLTRTSVLKEDAALAAFYLLSLALGVTLVSLKGSNVDLLNVLFGSVLALDDDALFLLAGVSSLTLLTLAALYRSLVLECVDPGFLASVSRSGGPTHFVFLGLVVLNLVAGFQALGTLLSVGIMMLPAASAAFWSARLSGMFVAAIAVGALASLFGLLGSYHTGVPSGPAIVLAAGALYLVSIAFGASAGLVWRLLPARRHRAA
ncbi:metal ABC transporter permease [Chenggangzhangella methanolivorans]|uniref:Metal ABC transporter permease n=1 Tax=Chenggangzhangella methanolivorans TaxID=1437009 RepID=A0A9E6RAV0_9HYPH|nr:metal ABC transporter permease [Chenggangzhangella methanolivorans]QZO00970.1 metal ABC transporter permease [Chenggangzhangella methanolivorans]